MTKLSLSTYERCRYLWAYHNRQFSAWETDFVKSQGQNLRDGRKLSTKQQTLLTKLFVKYRVPDSLDAAQLAQLNRQVLNRQAQAPEIDRRKPEPEAAPIADSRKVAFEIENERLLEKARVSGTEIRSLSDWRDQQRIVRKGEKQHKVKVKSGQRHYEDPLTGNTQAEPIFKLAYGFLKSQTDPI